MQVEQQIFCFFNCLWIQIRFHVKMVVVKDFWDRAGHFLSPLPLLGKARGALCSPPSSLSIVCYYFPVVLIDVKTLLFLADCYAVAKN